jgi:hypothetical protein
MNPEPQPTVPVAARRAPENAADSYRAETVGLLLMITGLNAVEQALRPRGGQKHDHTESKR